MPTEKEEIIKQQRCDNDLCKAHDTGQIKIFRKHKIIISIKSEIEQEKMNIIMN